MKASSIPTIPEKFLRNNGTWNEKFADVINYEIMYVQTMREKTDSKVVKGSYFTGLILALKMRSQACHEFNFGGRCGHRRMSRTPEPPQLSLREPSGKAYT